MSSLKTSINLPAYDQDQKGLIIKLDLSCSPSVHFSVSSSGEIANALKRSLIRTVEIITSLHTKWHCLCEYTWHLSSYPNHFIVKDTKSTGIPLAIACFNIFNGIKGGKICSHSFGTGILRHDGSFDAASHESIKEKAIKNKIGQDIQFITSKTCSNLFELFQLISTNHRRIYEKQ